MSTPSTAAPAGEKIQKMLAAAGLGSRREIERWIAARRISVNGKVAILGDRASVTDRILVDGRPVNLGAAGDRTRVLLYNKPEGEICTSNDPEGRDTVFARLPTLKHGRWILVGRLDINSSGLLLFTNDGELANQLMHPSSEVEREYLVRVHGVVDEPMLARLREGVSLEDGIGRFKEIRVGAGNRSNQWFSVTLCEGRNREVRRLWETQGVEVSRLKRIRYGIVAIPSYVRRGEWLELSPEDNVALCKSVGLKHKLVALTPDERNARDRQIRKLRERGARQ
ncbi:MAG: 23S rRNA pseudouridine(2605) synthase RluB [Porticoccaceae bacterium]